jgi:insertion element IS1 protein InsB
MRERTGGYSVPRDHIRFVGSQSQQRWLWHAIDHHTGQVLAYVFGAREDRIFLELKALLQPFGITRFYTDGWGAYRRHLD